MMGVAGSGGLYLDQPHAAPVSRCACRQCTCDVFARCAGRALRPARVGRRRAAAVVVISAVSAQTAKPRRKNRHVKGEVDRRHGCLARSADQRHRSPGCCSAASMRRCRSAWRSRSACSTSSTSPIRPSSCSAPTSPIIGNTVFGIDPILAAVIVLPAFYLLGMAVYQVYYVAFERRDDQSLRGLSFFFGLLFIAEVGADPGVRRRLSLGAGAGISAPTCDLVVVRPAVAPAGAVPASPW